MNLPKFGAMTSIYGNILNEIEEFGRLGFDFVEFSLEEPIIMPDFFSKNKERILNLLEKYDMFAVAHAPLFTVLATNFKEVKAGWNEVIESYIKNTSVLKVSKMNFHTFHLVPISKYVPENVEKKFLLGFVKSLRELVELGKKYMMDVVVENAIKISGYSEARHFRYLTDKVPCLGMSLDVGHAFVKGGMKNIENYVKLLGNRIEHVHMHDNHGESDEHLPIGKGKINWKQVVKLLKEINYDKTITFEVFTSKKDALKSREKIRKLWMKN
jgi:sugar phosphate isomerase/epimerase